MFKAEICSNQQLLIPSYILSLVAFDSSTTHLHLTPEIDSPAIPRVFHEEMGTSTGVTTNSATATNCVSLHDLRGMHRIKLIPSPNLLRGIYLARVLMA